MQCQRLKFKLKTALKFWVQFPNPQLKVISGPAYYTKEIKQLIQMLEADHLSPSREFNFPKLFQNDKYFESNDVSKTLKFYEFILVDTKFVQIFYIMVKCKMQNFKNYFKKLFGTKSFHSQKVFSKLCSSNL